MRRLKKKIFLSACGGVVAVLGIVRLAFPEVAQPRQEAASQTEKPAATPSQDEEKTSTKAAPQSIEKPVPPQGNSSTTAGVLEFSRGGTEKGLGGMELKRLSSDPSGRVKWHPVRSVPSYAKCFPDVQEVQILAAKRWGVSPVRNREEAEQKKNQLVYIAANPLYCIDDNLTHSIPYLVPRASELLSLIGRSYLDSLYVKGIPLHRIIVTSILRTEDDVTRLQRHNGNAESQSCHLFGTTFDVCYNRFSTVSPPGEPERRAVQNDTLKWVLSEVLRDVREQGRCYVKYEVKQGCFHITVR